MRTFFGKNRTKSEQGIALALVLVTLFLITVLGFALGTRGVQSLVFSSDAQNANAAFYAAQSGVSRSLYAIERSDPLFTTCLLGSVCTFPVPASKFFSIGSNIFSLADGSTFSLNIIYNNSSKVFPAPDGTSVPAGMYYIQSSGTSNSVTKKASVLVSISYQWPFNYAAFGGNSVTLGNNSSTDSYNPSGSQGNVGSNGTVTFQNNSSVHGAVSVPPSGVISPNPPPSPAFPAPLSNAISLPPVVDPQGGYNANNNPTNITTLTSGQYGTVTVNNGGNLKLLCNTNGQPSYFSIGSLSLSNNSSLIVDPVTCSGNNPAKLYLYNGFTLNNNDTVNSTNTDTSLLVYGMSTLNTISIGNNSQDYFVLYAPSAAITINNNSNNTDFYGSAVGATINLTNNTRLHYDTALSSDANASPFPVLTIQAWKSQ